jgi:thymidylate synthase
MAAEAAWILGGQDDAASIAPYSKEISRFSDDGQTFYGAYGPKVVAQWNYCLERLLTNHTTRQAVLSIWRENPPGWTKDVPCTLSWQFLLRDGRLNLNSTMRSSDVWLGWPYDVFTQSMAILAMCCELVNHGVAATPGHVYLTAGSQHLYERNLAQAYLTRRKQWDPGQVHVTDTALLDFEGRQALVDHLWLMARKDTTADDLKHDFLLGLKQQLDKQQRSD